MNAIQTKVRERAVTQSAGGAPAAVLAVGADGRVLAANRSACKILGRGRVELLGLALADIVISTRDLAGLTDEVDDQGLAHGEAALRHRDGSSVPVRFQVTRIDLADGSLYLWAAQRLRARRSMGRDRGRRAARALRVSDRELEIVQLIADGLGNREIAQTLHISLETVKTYVRRLLGKLEARGRAHAVAIAWRKELVD